MSGRCVPPAYGSLRTKTSSRCGLLGQHRRDGVGHRAEMDGNVLGLGDHAAALVEQGGRAVAPLLDVGRERGADEHGAHLLGDRAERAAENLELNVHVRVSLQVAPSLAPTHPRGSQQVDPSSSSTAGPATSSRADLLGSIARARADLRRADGDELDRTVPVERSRTAPRAPGGRTRPGRRRAARSARRTARRSGGPPLRRPAARPLPAAARRTTGRGLDARRSRRGRARTGRPRPRARAPSRSRAPRRARRRAAAPLRRRRRARSRADRGRARPRRCAERAASPR